MKMMITDNNGRLEVFKSFLLLFDVRQRWSQFPGQLWKEAFFRFHDPVNCLPTRCQKHSAAGSPNWSYYIVNFTLLILLLSFTIYFHRTLLVRSNILFICCISGRIVYVCMTKRYGLTTKMLYWEITFSIL